MLFILSLTLLHRYTASYPRDMPVFVGLQILLNDLAYPSSIVALKIHNKHKNLVYKYTGNINYFQHMKHCKSNVNNLGKFVN